MFTTTLRMTMFAALAMAGSCFAGEAARAGSGDTGNIQWYAPKVRPDFPPAVAKLGSEAVALINQGKWQEAIDKLDRALKEMPDAANFYENRGICYQKLGKFELAVADYTKALTLDPAMAPILYENRGYSYKFLGKPDLAVADFTQALAKAPDRQAPLLLERGRMLVDLGELKRAEQDFNKAKEHSSTRAPAYSELAYLALGRKDFPSCIALASTAIQANTKFVDGWVNRAACKMMSGKLAPAEKDLNEAIRLEPGFAPAYVNRTAVYVAMGNCRSAQADADTVAQIAPRLADVARKIVAGCK